MRIAMVSEHASPLAAIGGVDAGGQNVHVAALATALAARRHEVVVYTRRDSPSLPDRVRLPSGVVVEHVPAGPPTDVPKDQLLPHMASFAEHLADRMALERPDVVHGHFWMSGVASVRAARAVSPSLPVVQTFHALGTVKRRHQGADDTSPHERLSLERYVGTAADTVLATCTDEVDELAQMGVARERVDVVPCGVDVSVFTPDGPAAPRPARARILVVGRMVPRKGIDDVITAMASLPDAELIVAGGPDAAALAVDPEAQRLRGLIDSLGVQGRVHLLGRVPRAELPMLIRSADVMVCAPWYEPFGIVPLEAMACGVPVVASAVGGLLDTVRDGVNGLHVPPRQPATIARAVRSLLDRPSERARMGRRGVAIARSEYTWDTVARRTEAVYLRAQQRAARRNVAGGLATGAATGAGTGAAKEIAR
jgi:D-inositol-3-phosphate glycosyltransferase